MERTGLRWARRFCVEPTGADPFLTDLVHAHKTALTTLLWVFVGIDCRFFPSVRSACIVFSRPRDERTAERERLSWNGANS